MDCSALLSQFDGMTLVQAETVFRESMIRRALVLTKGHRSKTAAMLGVHRNTLCRIMENAGIPPSKAGGWQKRKQGNTTNRGNQAWQALSNEDRSHV